MAIINYNVVAVSVSIWFNQYGDHDHDGMMFVLEEHKDVLEYVKNMQSLTATEPVPIKLIEERDRLITTFDLLSNDPNKINQWLPDTRAKARLPHPLIVPLVLRVAKGDTVKIKLENKILGRSIGLHLVGPGSNIDSDGSNIWDNTNSLVATGLNKTFTWNCNDEGVFVMHDAGDFRGDEAGTNAHGLFGALIVEPAGSRWTDPENKNLSFKSGLYADIHQRSQAEIEALTKPLYPNRDNPVPAALTPAYPAQKASFREFVIFIHDEPHWEAPHSEAEPDPCGFVHEHTAGSLMPISYRAEPMISREGKLWEMMRQGKIDPNNTVVNEEQHHSCWLFGEPATPVLKAYLGDPVRIRLIHAGVKETHVFHLHVYEWNATFGNPNSNIIDAITISPQTAHTIAPLYGAGNRQMVPGDVIWHCHLYPHFHHGMWGMFRTFDRLQNGIIGQRFNGDTGIIMTDSEYDALTEKDKNRFARQLGKYPDGSPIIRLEPLPDREPPIPQDLTRKKLGFPHFISGEYGQKSFNPPWHKANQSDIEAEGWVMNEYDYRPATTLELNAFNIDPKPGELYTAFPHNDSARSVHTNTAGTPLTKSSTIKHDIDVLMTPIEYNSHGWWDPHGHLYALAGHNIKTFSEVVHDTVHEAVHHEMHENPALTQEEAMALVVAKGIQIEPTKQEPFFFRCNKTNVMQLTLHNRLEKHIAATPFDYSWPKGKQEYNCNKFDNSKRECGLHVHIVKFDPITCDGASTGWNYMSAPGVGKKIVYRWWADEEFGTIFVHDHCFANYRQKHGLFAALLVEPENATFHNPLDHSEIITGIEAVIKYSTSSGEKAYREFCVGNGDWIPLFKQNETTLNGATQSHDHATGDIGFAANVPYMAHGNFANININYGMPIEPPSMPDSMDDNGVFGVNYRCEPLAERNNDPAEWYNSKPFIINGEHGAPPTPMFYGDPSTSIFKTISGDPIRIRLLQGSHEEQHSFQIHGMRWQRFWKDTNSPIRSQQTLGISEAFTFDIFQQANTKYQSGDYLWKFASAEDLWLGCWGFIRAFTPDSEDVNKPLPIINNALVPANVTRPTHEQCSRFTIKVKAKTIEYNPVLSDPFGLIYELSEVGRPGGPLNSVNTNTNEPLVIRCRKGEWVAITIINELSETIEPEPMAPQLLHDDGMRLVSSSVSLHADKLYFDVKENDGSNVGYNMDSTVKTSNTITYYWYADVEGPVSLQDMADIRNHRHHGLIGALIVHASDATPYAVNQNASTASLAARKKWFGTRVTVRYINPLRIIEDQVLFIQDGLRYYLYGNPAIPIGDFPGDVGENLPDTEDQGLKGFNYKSEPSSHARGYKFQPSTPVINLKANDILHLHLFGACDKPRNHSFTLHGHSWPEYSYLGANSPQLSAESGITSGYAKTLRIVGNAQPGKYMYRSGVLKYAVEQGLWGILNIK